jgi:TPR repeat protein
MHSSSSGLLQERRWSESNIAEAVRLFHAEVNRGHVNAQYCLGVCYTKGTGVDQDHAEAVRLYRTVWRPTRATRPRSSASPG